MAGDLVLVSPYQPPSLIHFESLHLVIIFINKVTLI